MTDFSADSNSLDLTTAAALKDAMTEISFIVDKIHINTGAEMAVSLGNGEAAGEMDTVFFGPVSMGENTVLNLELKTGIRLPTGNFINAETDSAGYARVFISGRLGGQTAPVETIVGTFSYDAILSDDDYTFTLTTDIYDEVLQ